MIWSLYRWSAKISRASSAEISEFHEGLRLGQQLAHAGLDPAQVVFVEGPTLGQLEVVVEAVLDGRADAEGGAGEQIEHRLGQDVGRRVADDVEAIVAVGGDDGDPVAVV